MSLLYEFQKKIRHITTIKRQKTEKLKRFRKKNSGKRAYLKIYQRKTAKKSKLL